MLPLLVLMMVVEVGGESESVRLAAMKEILTKTLPLLSRETMGKIGQSRSWIWISCNNNSVFGEIVGSIVGFLGLPSKKISNAKIVVLLKVYV